jgi:hypothetical protein
VMELASERHPPERVYLQQVEGETRSEAEPIVP